MSPARGDARVPVARPPAVGEAPFLTHPGVQATNWGGRAGAARDDREPQNWGGNKTREGADTAAALASMLRTAIQQGADPIEVLAEIQRTGQIPAGLVSALRGPVPVNPRVGPRPPGVRYRVVVTQISDHDAEVTFDHTAGAYIAAVAGLTGTRITATVDHDGDQLLRERLVAYISGAIHGP